MKKVLMFLACIVTLALPLTASAADYDVYPPGSIQAAIDSAGDGDTIYVHEGTYVEAVTINGKDLSLVAVGEVIVAPTSCGGHGDAIQVYNGNVTITGFTIDSDLECMGGIYARGGMNGAGPVSLDPVSLTAVGNTIREYEKNGLTVNGPEAYGHFRNNEVTGSGPVGPGSWAQNGIQFGFGATGEVMRNRVDSNWYTGADWMASGILVFEADYVQVQRNTVLNSQTGVAIETWCWYEPSASYNKVVKNTITDSEQGISVASYDLPWSTCDASANNNKVVNNLITTTGSGEVGIILWAGFDSVLGDGPYTPSSDNNKVIRNETSGYTYNFINVGDTTTKVHANIPVF